MRNVAEKSCTENKNTHFTFDNFYFSKIEAFFEVMWKETDDMMYFLIAIGMTPGGSSTVHIYTHTTTKSTRTIRRTTQLNRTTQIL